ncbi:MAG: M15 family metallopeptidase [Chthoniobacterales bacterium]
MSQRNYIACHNPVSEQHQSPPNSFLDQLIDAINPLPDAVFAQNNQHDIYSVMLGSLGPYTDLLHRKAVMCEVLRVQAAFESDWNWNEGVDTTNQHSLADKRGEETGAFQVSWDSMHFDTSLKDCVRPFFQPDDVDAFINQMKLNHALAVEYCARLLRFNTTWCGTINHASMVISHVRRDAVAEFKSFLQLNPVAGGDSGGDSGADGGPLPGGGGGDGPLHTPNGRPEIEEMFGRPNNNDFTLNEAWESDNITLVRPPDGWQLFYQDDNGLKPVSGIRLHRKVADGFRAVLTDIWNHVNADLGGNASENDIRKRLHDLRLDQHSGGFNYRVIHGTGKLSLHSYGIAIDWDADHNPQGHSSHTMPVWWYDIWNAHGWVDGRHFTNPDPMHVQFASGA